MLLIYLSLCNKHMRCAFSIEKERRIPLFLCVGIKVILIGSYPSLKKQGFLIL